VGVIPESLLERVALRAGIVPVPLLETFGGLLLARTAMAGTQLGVFDAIGSERLAPAEVAARCGTDQRATAKLLFALAGHGYLSESAGRYELAPVARRWLLRDGPQTLRDNMLFRYDEWRYTESVEEFVRTGTPLDTHAKATGDEWRRYQRGMRSLSTYAAKEVARRLPVPSRARELLDIGGSHGYFSVELCRRHQGLRSTVLELPAAIEHAAPLLAHEEMGERVVHRAGDALSDDLGSERYDVVFVGNLVHHFDDAQNLDLARRVARALRPGGVHTIFDVLSGSSPRKAGQIGAALELYFALTSLSGTWPAERMAHWQRAAGLLPRRPMRLRTSPAQGVQIAVKPGGSDAQRSTLALLRQRLGRAG